MSDEVQNLVDAWRANMEDASKDETARERYLRAKTEAARAEARAEGFRAAKEKAAGRYDKRASEHRRAADETSNEKLRLEHHELAEQWESEARAIRAMQDDGSEQAPPPTSRCQCGRVARDHDDLPPNAAPGCAGFRWQGDKQ
jgi:hypothetical protein